MATTRPQAQRGFTLVEAMVALAIVAMVVIGYIGIRTSALLDATLARNMRLAREIAEQKLSELKAGAREVPPTSGEEHVIDEFEGFSWKVVIGEAAVAEAESSVGQAAAGEDQIANDRIEWQRDRDNFRKAQARGQTAAEFEEQRSEDVNLRLAEKAPSATEFEEVAVVVYFPKLEPEYPDQKEALLIKARLSTLAISGMTPEQAAQVAQAKGQAGDAQNPGGGAGASSGGAGGGARGGNAGNSGGAAAAGESGGGK